MVEYKGFEIIWEDDEEMFISEIDGTKVRKRTLREIRKIIDNKDNVDKFGFLIDSWSHTSSVSEVEIIRRKDNGFVVRSRGNTGRGKTEYMVYKNNEKNREIVKEIKDLILKQENIQKIIDDKIEQLEGLK